MPPTPLCPPWLQASRSRRAEAVVVEAKMDKGQGPVATVIVKRGTLKVRTGGRNKYLVVTSTGWGWGGAGNTRLSLQQ